MNIGEWLRHASDVLEESGSPDPQIDAKWIAEDTLGLTRAELHFESTRGIDAAQLEQLDERLMRRAEGEPVQYILHSAYFMGLKFYVDDRVLIPRQDTETLVEAVIVALHELESPDVLDLCAGSGAIGLSIAQLCPGARVTLADVSAGACEVAARNRDRLGLRADVVCGDLFCPVRGRQFDLICCNPPYIPTADLDGLQREVRREPRIALDGGADGLDFYRRIAGEYRAFLRPGGALMLEIGWDQAEAVRALFAGGEVVRDLCGRDRVIVIRE